MRDSLRQVGRDKNHYFVQEVGSRRKEEKAKWLNSNTKIYDDEEIDEIYRDQSFWAKAGGDLGLYESEAEQAIEMQQDIRSNNLESLSLCNAQNEIQRDFNWISRLPKSVLNFSELPN